MDTKTRFVSFLSAWVGWLSLACQFSVLGERKVRIALIYVSHVCLCAKYCLYRTYFDWVYSALLSHSFLSHHLFFFCFLKNRPLASFSFISLLLYFFLFWILDFQITDRSIVTRYLVRIYIYEWLTNTKFGKKKQEDRGGEEEEKEKDEFNKLWIGSKLNTYNKRVKRRKKERKMRWQNFVS